MSLQKIVRHDQRLDRLAGVAGTDRDGLVGGLVQVDDWGRSGFWACGHRYGRQASTRLGTMRRSRCERMFSASPPIADFPNLHQSTRNDALHPDPILIHLNFESFAAHKKWYTAVVTNLRRLLGRSLILRCFSRILGDRKGIPPSPPLILDSKKVLQYQYFPENGRLGTV